MHTNPAQDNNPQIVSQQPDSSTSAERLGFAYETMAAAGVSIMTRQAKYLVESVVKKLKSKSDSKKRDAFGPGWSYSPGSKWIYVAQVRRNEPGSYNDQKFILDTAKDLLDQQGYVTKCVYPDNTPVDRDDYNPDPVAILLFARKKRQ